MPSQEVNRYRKPEDKEEIGRVHNEPEQRAGQEDTFDQEGTFGQGTAPLQEEIGVVKNESSGIVTPSEPEIGTTENESTGTVTPSEPEIGTTENEPHERK
jgi:hypothetical protein